jgi:hypothetical protein
MVEVIRAEQKRILAHLDQEDQDIAYDQWLFHEGPFLNDLCLTVIVGIRHHVERELVQLAALTCGNGVVLSSKQYRQNVQTEREVLQRSGWAALIKKLHLDSFPEWKSSMKALQLLANSYKHDIWLVPETKMLAHFGLDQSLNYMPIPESDCFREGLAQYLGLPKERADYCSIAEEFLNRAERFLQDVSKQPMMSGVKPGRVSLFEFGC